MEISRPVTPLNILERPVDGDNVTSEAMNRSDGIEHACNAVVLSTVIVSNFRRTTGR